MAQLLIIDDDVALRQALTRHLEHAGHAVRQASQGTEAVAALKRLSADLAIVDIFMPGQGGLQTIGRMKQDWPGLRIIAMSGAAANAPLDVREHALALGADSFLRKPFEASADRGSVPGQLPIRRSLAHARSRGDMWLDNGSPPSLSG
jgi:CheY-like chemotaxis protein